MKDGIGVWARTAINLRPVQVYGRVWFRLRRPTPDRRPAPPPAPITGTWVRPAARAQVLSAPRTFDLLGVRHALDEVGWDGPGVDRLWRYHQHYFDDLTAVGAETRRAWQEALVTEWIEAHPPGAGSGWEPYPTSLRIVNWIKWALAGATLTTAMRDSLACQARWLAQRIEWHLLGNHLLVNAKALLFAGAFFGGAEAERWRACAARILTREIPEQILHDGGHCERSPMYHALVWEDLLDLLNLHRVYDGVLQAPLAGLVTQAASRMAVWMRAMTHPDGEIALFNDAAFGIAPPPETLHAYGAQLGVSAPRTLEAVERLPDSGYLRVCWHGQMVLVDAAPLGPRYLPAHGHADTLSFEWSCGARRVLVNGGTSTYAAGAERLRQRGTAAHNTVVVDGRDSSEVWGSFRVGRCARPTTPLVQMGPPLTVEAAHDGYGGGAFGTRRRWTFLERSLCVEDWVPAGARQGEARFHLHPSVEATLDALGRVHLLADRHIVVHARQGVLRVEPATWHPRFGSAEATQCVVVATQSSQAVTEFSWA